VNSGADRVLCGLTPDETAALLRRMLEVPDEPRRRRWIELSSAVVLALATTASAWCAYQSNLWGGVQTFRLAAAARAGRESTQQSLAAFEGRAFDAQVLIAYFEIKGRGDEKLASFLQERFRPEARKAFDAWLLTDPFNNPDAPKRPFEMAEYVQPEVREAKRLDDEEERTLTAAQHANEAADRYVLFTVLFASVLFFGGIGGTFRSDRLKSAAFVIAIVLFLGTVVAVGTMPICKE
jgi:hypothetical protein